jgi:hypothetical protein
MNLKSHASAMYRDIGNGCSHDINHQDKTAALDSRPTF